MTIFQSDLDASNHRDLMRHRARDAARWLQCAADGDGFGTTEKFLDRFPGSVNRAALEHWRHKTAMGSAPSAWGSDLVSPPILTAAILDLSRPLTLPDRLVALGARQVPVNTRVPALVSGLQNFVWAGYGRAKPLNAAVLEQVSVPPATAAGIVAFSEEVMQFSPGGADTIVDVLPAAAAEFVSSQFINSAGSETPFAPAGIATIGSPAAGSSTGDPVEDLRTALQAYVDAGGAMSSAVILISSTNAAALATLHPNDFPNVTTRGGTLAGCPCVASDAVGDLLIVLDVRRLLIADPGELDIRIARHASLEMVDDPTQDGGGAVLVSLWQSNLVGVRVERRISWAYSGTVAVVDGVDYLAEGSPS